MGYLKCKECGGSYQLQEGETPEEFESCGCGGELEHHLSSHDLSRTEHDEDYNEKRRRSNHTIIVAIIILVFLALSVVFMGALVVHNAYQDSSTTLNAANDVSNKVRQMAMLVPFFS